MPCRCASVRVPRFPRLRRAGTAAPSVWCGRYRRPSTTPNRPVSGNIGPDRRTACRGRYPRRVSPTAASTTAGDPSGPHRLQSHRGEPEQAQRVQVFRSAPVRSVPAEAPVQTGRGGASVVPGTQHTDPGTGRHPPPDRHLCLHRFVGGPQTARVIDRYDRFARDRPGVYDDPRPRGEDGLARCAGQVDPAMARQPVVLGVVEALFHGGARSQGPVESPVRLRHAGMAGRRGQDEYGQGDHRDPGRGPTLTHVPPRPAGRGRFETGTASRPRPGVRERIPARRALRRTRRNRRGTG